MTDGDATPAAERAAPKRAPLVVVARRFAIFAVERCRVSSMDEVERFFSFFVVKNATEMCE